MHSLKKIRKLFDRAGFKEIEVAEKHKAIFLSGNVDHWDRYLEAGYLAAGKGYRGVVNDIQVRGLIPDSFTVPSHSDKSLEGRHFHAAVVGGGVIGAAITRELTRWQIDVALLEKENDLSRHASGRNNGIIHPAFAAPPGSLKARYNTLGNRMFTQEAQELGVPLAWPGLLVVFPSRMMHMLMPLIRRRARQNGVRGVEYLTPEQVRAREPNIYNKQQGGFFLPEGGIVSPYKLTMAYGENAISNGAQVFLQTAVIGFDLIKNQGGNRIVRVNTNRGSFTADLVINAAGIWADQLAEMAGDRFYTIHPRRGAIAILDKKVTHLLKYNIGQLLIPAGKSKGGGVTPTIDGNILLGPTAEEIPHREDFATRTEDLAYIYQHQMFLNKALRSDQVITYFSGNRACTFDEEFVIEPSSYVENFIHVAGIQSPGLTAAPAIAREVGRLAAEILKKTMALLPNAHFNPCRKPLPVMSALSFEERSRLIKENPAYGKIVCRCETVSEGEITDSLRSPLGVASLDGVKQRVRTGMGRCQGGFCTPRLVDIVAREAGINIEKVSKSGPGSELVFKKTKGLVDYSSVKILSEGGKEEESHD